MTTRSYYKERRLVSRVLWRCGWIIRCYFWGFVAYPRTVAAVVVVMLGHFPVDYGGAYGKYLINRLGRLLEASVYPTAFKILRCHI